MKPMLGIGVDQHAQYRPFYKYATQIGRINLPAVVKSRFAPLLQLDRHCSLLVSPEPEQLIVVYCVKKYILVKRQLSMTQKIQRTLGRCPEAGAAVTPWLQLVVMLQCSVIYSELQALTLKFGTRGFFESRRKLHLRVFSHLSHRTDEGNTLLLVLFKRLENRSCRHCDPAV